MAVKRWTVAGAAAVLATGIWARGEALRFVPTPLLPMPAHDQYAAALTLTGAARTEAGRAWREAADQVLEDPSLVSGHYEATLDGEANARAWRLKVRRGQRVTVETTQSPGTLFVDLFDADRRRVASAPPRAARVSHVAKEDGVLIARLQATLDGRITSTVVQRTEPSLAFPVLGLTGRAVQSSFGAGRDAGRRQHEGIDIFAPRGTPAIAAADGWIARQTRNQLGGNVVWLWSPDSGVSLYYAHLERQAVKPGDRVRTGDVVGYVGNSGNARGTAPHLHFGVYARADGAVDPLPYVAEMREARHRRAADGKAVNLIE